MHNDTDVLGNFEKATKVLRQIFMLHFMKTDKGTVTS